MVSVAFSSMAVPPAKSTPKFRPRVPRKKIDAVSIISENTVPAMRRLMKLRCVSFGQIFISMAVSPRS